MRMSWPHALKLQVGEFHLSSFLFQVILHSMVHLLCCFCVWYICTCSGFVCFCNFFLSVTHAVAAQPN